MKIAIMGYGTIGSGVEEVIRVNQEVIAHRTGEPVDVKYVLDLRDFPGSPIEDRLVRDYHIIAEDPEVGVVVETMGGVEPAYTFVRAMLEAGKHVTTSNKNLVAARGAELIEVARAHKVNFEFEASVGGGNPNIRPQLECLTAEVIEEVSGIHNGTTNYMLSKMGTEDADFDTVLKDAQDKGYAEKDPTADIEGYDPCRKIAILTSLICGAQVDYEDIHTEGITQITKMDMQYAKAMHCQVKLLAMSRREGDAYSCIVAPFLLPQEHPLCMVNDVFNAVFVHGNMLGDAMFYGSGAGSLPTASAVVGDIISMIRHKDGHIPVEWSREKAELLDYRKSSRAFFVRSTSTPQEIARAFGGVQYVDIGRSDETAFLTPVMTESDFEEKAARLTVVNRIRFGVTLGHI